MRRTIAENATKLYAATVKNAVTECDYLVAALGTEHAYKIAFERYYSYKNEYQVLKECATQNRRMRERMQECDAMENVYHAFHILLVNAYTQDRAQEVYSIRAVHMVSELERHERVLELYKQLTMLGAISDSAEHLNLYYDMMLDYASGQLAVALETHETPAITKALTAVLAIAQVIDRD